MADTIPIQDISTGDEFLGFYALNRCDFHESDDWSRLDIELSDGTGSLPGVVWDNARELNAELNKGDVVKVKGRLSSYRDKPQVKVEKIRKASDGEYNPEAFLPATPKDMDTLKHRVDELVNSITNPHLSALAQEVFGNEQFMTNYARTPGGMQWHHPYIGGLMEHSVGVTEICDFIASQHPELNRDLLVIAGLLHDVGKIREYSATTVIEYTDEGRLEGHIVIGERFVRNMCERIENFPDKLRMLLSHLILSHQGFKKFSTPVEPMIPEGFVLYYADEIDSKLNAIDRIVTRNRENGNSWSEYIRVLERFLYTDTRQADNDEQ